MMVVIQHQIEQLPGSLGGLSEGGAPCRQAAGAGSLV